MDCRAGGMSVFIDADRVCVRVCDQVVKNIIRLSKESRGLLEGCAAYF